MGKQIIDAFTAFRFARMENQNWTIVVKYFAKLSEQIDRSQSRTHTHFITIKLIYEVEMEKR